MLTEAWCGAILPNDGTHAEGCLSMQYRYSQFGRPRTAWNRIVGRWAEITVRHWYWTAGGLLVLQTLLTYHNHTERCLHRTNFSFNWQWIEPRKIELTFRTNQARSKWNPIQLFSIQSSSSQLHLLWASPKSAWDNAATPHGSNWSFDLSFLPADCKGYRDGEQPRWRDAPAEADEIPAALAEGHLLSYHRRPSSRYSNRRDRHLCQLGGGAGCKGLGVPADGDQGGIRVLLISTKQAK
jgi:hypothetical protein